MESLAVVAVATLGGACALAASVAAPAAVALLSANLTGYANRVHQEFRNMCRHDMPLKRAKRLIIRTIAGAFAFGLLVGGGVMARIAIASLFAALGAFAPWAMVVLLRRRRRQAIDAQVIDTIQTMQHAVTAGRNLHLTLELVAEKTEPPMADEIGRMVTAMHMTGQTIEDALTAFATRMRNEDLTLLVESILTLRRNGGNLAERFHMIADTIVERKRTLGKIQAVTASARSAGWMASWIPLALVPVFALMMPDYMRPLYTTPLGWALLTAVVTLCGGGLWLMLSLSRIDP